MFACVIILRTRFDVKFSILNTRKKICFTGCLGSSIKEKFIVLQSMHVLRKPYKG